MAAHACIHIHTASCCKEEAGFQSQGQKNSAVGYVEEAQLGLETRVGGRERKEEEAGEPHP